jgi:hypothetical protein
MFATRCLLVNTHWVLECGIRVPILIVRRTANAYASVAEVGSSFDGVIEVVDGLTRTNMSLLVDMRLAPPRNDPEFERAADDQPKFLTRDFLRSAALIRTAIGLLHVQRHMQQMGLPVKVFADEQQAFDYLLGRSEPASGDAANPPSKRRS